MPHRLGERAVILVLGVLATATAGWGPRRCLAAAGDLDPGFGQSGIASTSPRDGLNMASSVALQSDGRIVVAGRSLPAAEGLDAVTLVRYLPDGAPDPAFGDGGVVLATAGGKSAYARDVAVGVGGRIIAAGSKYVGAIGRNTLVFDLIAMRFMPDGRPDPSFGTDGLVTAHFGDRITIGEAVLEQPDGKVVVAGRTYDYLLFNDRPVVARFNADGTPDLSFGTDGGMLLDRAVAVYDAAVAPDGRIVLVGSTSSIVMSTEMDLVLVRLTPDGRLDPTFGNGGYAVADLAGGGDEGRRVLFGGDGRMVVAGYMLGQANQNKTFVVARFESNGRLDGTFGQGGVSVAPSRGQDCPDGPGLALQPDGDLVVGGERDFDVVRFDSAGQLDVGLSAGEEPFAAPGNPTCAADVALQPDGAIVVAGTQFTDNNERASFLVARFEGQSPTLAGEVSNRAPLAGGEADFRFTITDTGYVPFRGARLVASLPAALEPAGAVEVEPAGAGSPGPEFGTVENLDLLAGHTVALTVPTRVRADVIPGTPLEVAAVLHPGPGHNPVSVRIDLVTEGPPITAPDVALTAVDTPVTLNVVANDRDPNGDPFVVTAVSDPSWGTAAFEATGTVTYTPNPGYVGPDAFTYQVTDSAGLSSTGQVRVVVAERLWKLLLPFASQHAAALPAAVTGPAAPGWPARP